MNDQHCLSALSFYDTETCNLWNVERSGDYATDCATGRLAAVELLTFEAAADNSCPSLLGHVANAIAEQGQHTGVEIGFFTGIMAAAQAGFAGAER